MSVEVDGLFSQDRRLVNTVGVATGELLLAQGVQPDLASTAGVEGAEYGMSVALTALRDMGMWPPKGFDPDEFEVAAKAVVSRSK